MHFTRAPKQNIHCTSVFIPQHPCNTIHKAPNLTASRPPRSHTRLNASLFDLLLLQLDRLVVDEDTLALVWLRWSPLSDTASKRHEHLLIHALEQDTRGLWCGHLDTGGNSFFDRMSKAQLQAEEILAGEGLLASAALDCRSVSNTDKTNDDGMAFGNASYVVVEIRP